jgi:hypothetical protein
MFMKNEAHSKLKGFSLIVTASLLAVSFLGITGCSQGTGGAVASQGTSGNATSSSNSGGSGTTYKMTLHKVMDPEGTGKLACTYLLPDGWTAQDQIKWFPQNLLTPVIGASVMKSADGLVELDTMSGANFSFSHSPPGDTGIMPPKRTTDFLISAWKKDHPGVNFEVLDRQDTPVDTSSTPTPQGSSLHATRGVVKLRFKKGGQVLVTKSQARIDVFQTDPMETGMGIAYEGGWLVTSAYAVTAPEDQLDAAMKLSGIVLTSVRTDPHFYNTVVQVQQMQQQAFKAQQGQIAEISHIISQTNDQISDTIMGSYNTSQAAEQKEVTGFDDYIRGVDKYQTGDGPVDLPSGYAHAFSDDNGHYIVTDNHLYDPNVGNTGPNWHELQRNP